MREVEEGREEEIDGSVEGREREGEKEETGVFLARVVVVTQLGKIIR